MLAFMLVCFYLSICICVCSFACLSLYLYVCLIILLSSYLFVCLLIYNSIFVFVPLLLCVFIYLFVYKFPLWFHMFAHLPVRLLFTSLFINPSLCSPLSSLSLYPSPSHLSPPNRLAIPLSTSVPNEYAFILTIIPLTNYQICSIQNVPPDVSVFLQYILLYLHHTFIPTIITYFHAFYIHSQA